MKYTISDNTELFKFETVEGLRNIIDYTDWSDEEIQSIAKLEVGEKVDLKIEGWTWTISRIG